MLCITNFSQIIACLNCFLGLYEICISRSANKQRVDCGRAVRGIDHTTRIRSSSISGLGRQRVNEDTLATHKVFSNPLGLLRITPGIWVDAGLRDFFFFLKEKIHKFPWTWSLHLITARDWAWKLETLLWLACDCIFNCGLGGLQIPVRNQSQPLHLHPLLVQTAIRNTQTSCLEGFTGGSSKRVRTGPSVLLGESNRGWQREFISIT